MSITKTSSAHARLMITLGEFASGKRAAHYKYALVQLLGNEPEENFKRLVKRLVKAAPRQTLLV